jgi:hypothetical protein
MNRIILPLLSLLFAAGCATTGTPGVTVGDLTSKGAKKLTSAELKPLLSGATLKGAASNTGNPFEMVTGPDGTFKGTVRTGQGPFAFDGTWRVNEKDQYCTDIKTSGARQTSSCAYLYSVDGKHYMAEAEGPSAPALERTISR